MRISGQLILWLWLMLPATPLAYPSDQDRQLLQWIRSPTFLQMEFFTMATGSYLAFPAAHPESGDELAFHVISRSASHLWSRLSSMRQMDRTIDEVTREVSSVLKDLLLYRNAVNFVCQKLDTILKDDPKLGLQYAWLKGNASAQPIEKVYFWRSIDDLGALSADKMASWMADRQIRRLLLNGDFLIYAAGSNFTETDDRDYWLTAESILRLSNEPQQAERVQRLYDEALTEAAAEINSDLDFRQPISKLFEKLKRKFEGDDGFVSLFDRLNATYA